MPYEIVYLPRAREHLRAMTASQRKTVLQAVKQQLEHQPTVKTRNRKATRPNGIAPWELRVAEFRVYYEVAEQPDPQVRIHAVGRKVRNVVLFPKQEPPNEGSRHTDA